VRAVALRKPPLIPIAKQLTYNIVMAEKWTIAIRPAEAKVPRKITKIIGLNGDGFSVVAPYHKARTGYLFKMLVEPNMHVPGPHELSWDDAIGYTADDRVKLSYHSDGFAQFSGENPGNIISGRDPRTGEAKGLGLFTNPLKTPTWSGPSVALTVWGIEDFEESTADDGLIVFEPSDFYYRGCQPADANAWILSIYSFPANVTPPVQFRGNDAIVEVNTEMLNSSMASVVKLKVVRFSRELVFLGLMTNRAVTKYRSTSGWILNGPGDFTLTRRGHVLMGIYPREDVPDTNRTLNRVP